MTSDRKKMCIAVRDLIDKEVLEKLTPLLISRQAIDDFMAGVVLASAAMHLGFRGQPGEGAYELANDILLTMDDFTEPEEAEVE